MEFWKITLIVLTISFVIFIIILLVVIILLPKGMNLMNLMPYPKNVPLRLKEEDLECLTGK